MSTSSVSDEIVVRNSSGFLGSGLESFSAQYYARLEKIPIDNACENESPNLGNLSFFDSTKTRNLLRIRFRIAHNQGIIISNGPCYLSLFPDVIRAPESIMSIQRLTMDSFLRTRSANG